MEKELRETLLFIGYGKQHSGVVPCPQDYAFYIQPFREAAQKALAIAEQADRTLSKYESTLKDAITQEAKLKELALSTFQQIENICGWTRLSQTAREDCIKLIERALLASERKIVEEDTGGR